MRRPDARALLAAAVLLAPFAAGAAVRATDDRRGSEAFRFADPEIAESSGLVVLSSGLVVTTNDSGDGARVFVVNPATGRTVRTPTWDGDPADVEALAPAGRAGGQDSVWVADIGDNRHVRDVVSLTLVPVGDGATQPATTYELRYPDGARDAEALVTHPFTGRLFVITKGVFAGEVHEVPWPLAEDRPNRTTAVARVAGIVTDATFLPYGGVVVVRTYARAVAYAYPEWEAVASWELPDQLQGEGVAVDGTDLLLSSEGVNAQVLREPLPPQVLAADLTGSPVWQVWRLLPWVDWLATA
jgi:hypothetical protein